MKILVTGASGFVGQTLVKQLLTKGHQVVVLTRNIPKAMISLGNKPQYIYWGNQNELPPVEAFSGVQSVINLMGEGIADKRWSDEQKQRIYNSRILGTRSLIDAIKQYNVKLESFVSTSAVGVYGDRGAEELTEASAPASDFLAKVCLDWEREALAAKNLGIRVVLLRVGVVVGKGGALAKMLPIFKLGAGGPIGLGRQFMSWVHVEDLASMYVFAVENKNLEGIYNATAPQPATNKDFSFTLGKALRRPAFSPAPPLALKLVFGEMSTVLLSSQKALPTRLKEAQFKYRYANLEMALTETVRS